MKIVTTKLAVIVVALLFMLLATAVAVGQASHLADSDEVSDSIDCATRLIVDHDLEDYEAYGVPFTEQIVLFLLTKHC